jgi:Na+/proline symporter
LVALVGVLAVASFAFAPRAAGAGSFYSGTDSLGNGPGLWTLVLSQVTTWIFARSLMNAAILGFYYGIAGVLAYAAYYVSFLTGAAIIDQVRFRHGAGSLQAFMRARFGRAGVAPYNVVVAARLLSEVFANLLVVGLIFGAAFSGAGYADEVAIGALALVGLAYSMLGGLRASLRTDVFQMAVFLFVLLAAFGAMVTAPGFGLGAVLTAPGVSGSGPGWVLLVVAALQVLSYPAHDPVMMDRGFLVDRRTTRVAFLHAFWISAASIFAFGLFGVQAGLIAVQGEAMNAVWERLFEPGVLFCLNAALIVSAMSTLDSTLSSAARLAIVEMRLGPATPLAGRIAMAVFMAGGVAFLMGGTSDLFAAVAVSGTAALFLAPVILFSIFGNWRIPVWSLLVAFAAALLAAAAYFFNGHDFMQALAGGMHKYTLLLWLSIAVLGIGVAAFSLGAASVKRRVA